MYMHHVICSLIYADLLFLVGLTSSVCVVSELIKKLERLRGGEKMADTDDFHDVWRTLCPVQEMEGGAGGLECRSGRSHIVQNYQKWSDGPDPYLQFLFKVKTRSWLWSDDLVLTEMSSLTRALSQEDVLVCCFMTVLLPIASGRTLGDAVSVHTVAVLNLV